jgi:queuine/archaeosine tRNA-ribosyltransferase
MTSEKGSTPILPTYMGHLLYTPADIHNHDEHVFGTFDIADVMGKDFGDRSIPEVMKVPQNIDKVFTFRSIFGPVVNCDSTGLSVLSRAGRKKITIDSYLQRALIDKPQILVALADETGPNAGHNRRRKAFERTWQWLTHTKQFLNEHSNELAGCKLFGVVINDSSNPVQLQKMTSSTIDTEVQGLVLGGWYQGENEKMRQQMVADVRSIMSEKKVSLPLMIQGIDTLDQIKECLAMGIDMIHLNYPYHQMKNGFAFCPFFLNSTKDTLSGRKRSRSENSGSDEKNCDKKKKVDDGSAVVASEDNISFRPPSHIDDDAEMRNQSQHNNGEDVLPSSVAGASAKANMVADVASINLWSEQYRKDVTVLQEHCECHSCHNGYTRSYIHHLLKSRELLADVLLYQHNQYQVRQLFENIDDQKASGKASTEIANWLEQVIPHVDQDKN